MLTILSTLFAFGVTIAILPSIIYYLNIKGVGDQIDGRRMHSTFTPTAGGLGVLIPALGTIFLFSSLTEDYDLIVFAICIGLVFLTGLLDDLFSLKATTKLIALILPAITLMVFANIKINSLYGLFGIYEVSDFISIPLTILVVVFLTNAFNLIDGIDGLLSIVSSFVFMIFGIWFLLIGEYSFALISLALLGGTVGFLVYNWHPARIFMGDTGSLSIGFTISILSIAFLKTNDAMPISDSYRIESPVSLIIALLIFPIFDTFRVFVLRVMEGRSPFSADKKHVHHYLHSLNFGPRKISLTLLTFNALAFFIVLSFNSVEDTLLLMGVFVFLLSCSGGMRVYKKIHFSILREQVTRKHEVEVN